MGYCRRLCTDLLVFTLQLRNTPENLARPSDEDCAISHRLKWAPLPLNEVGRTAQHVTEGEGRKEGNDRIPLQGLSANHLK